MAIFLYFLLGIYLMGLVIHLLVTTLTIPEGANWLDALACVFWPFFYLAKLFR